MGEQNRKKMDKRLEEKRREFLAKSRRASLYTQSLQDGDVVVCEDQAHKKSFYCMGGGKLQEMEHGPTNTDTHTNTWENDQRIFIFWGRMKKSNLPQDCRTK